MKVTDKITNFLQGSSANWNKAWKETQKEIICPRCGESQPKPIPQRKRGCIACGSHLGEPMPIGETVTFGYKGYSIEEIKKKDGSEDYELKKGDKSFGLFDSKESAEDFVDKKMKKESVNEELDMAQGMKALQKVAKSQKSSLLKWKDGETEINPIGAQFLLKVYDMLDIGGKQGFEKKIQSAQGFKNLAYMTRGVIFNEAILEDADLDEDASTLALVAGTALVIPSFVQLMDKLYGKGEMAVQKAIASLANRFNKKPAVAPAPRRPTFRLRESDDNMEITTGPKFVPDDNELVMPEFGCVVRLHAGTLNITSIPTNVGYEGEVPRYKSQEFVDKVNAAFCTSFTLSDIPRFT